MKTCRICKIDKDISEYHKKKGSKDGHRNECKICVKIIQEKYKENPNFKENQKQYDKIRYDKNKTVILDRKKEYYKENKDSIIEKKKQYRSRDEFKKNHKIWCKNYALNNRDIIYRYRRKNPHIIAWRSILYSTLNRLGTIKEGCTIDMLKYSALDLKYHLEKLFSEGMSWINHGEWHIDHIIPVSLFDKNTPVSVVCALSNLQPLWSTTREINGVIYEGNLNKSDYYSKNF